MKNIRKNEKICHGWELEELTMLKCPSNQSILINLQIQCNPYQNSNDTIRSNRKKNLEIHMKPQTPQIFQSNLG